MPSKKGKGVKKTKKRLKNHDSTTPTAQWDHIDSSQIVAIVAALQKEIREIENNRNWAQVERNNFQSFNDISIKEVIDTETEIKSVENDIEHVENQNRIERKVYARKVRYLEYEHRQTIQNICKEKVEKVLQQKKLENQTTNRVLLEMKKLKQEIRASEIKNSSNINLLKEEQTEERKNMMTEYEDRLSSLVHFCAQRLSNYKKEVHIRHECLMKQMEERKNLHIHNLIKCHDLAIDKSRKYYNKISSERKTKIDRLRGTITCSKARSLKKIVEATAITEENKEFSKLLSEARSKVSKFLSLLKHQEKDKESLQNTVAQVKKAKEYYSKLLRDCEALEEKLNFVQSRCDVLHNNFEDHISKATQNIECKRLILEH